MEALFDDLLIIDCASFIAGPSAATVLSDFGARVIKVEPPGGEGYRQFARMPGMPPSERNYPWEAINRNKQNLCLNLKEPQAHEALMRLVARADVFITNHPLPVRKRLKVDYETLAAQNPRLIYASFTPYGETGPDADLTGYDATAWWARSGLMDAVRASPETEPAISVPGMGDYPSGMALYGGIVSALYRRLKTGQGTFVSSSLLGNGLWSNSVRTQAALSNADMSVTIRRGKRSAMTELYYGSDQRWFLLTLLPQVQERCWPILADCVGHPEWLQDPRFAEPEQRRQNNATLTDLLEQAFATAPRETWMQRFDAAGITYGLIATYEDCLNDPQPRANGMITAYADLEDRYTVDSPVYLRDTAKRQPALGNELGADTRSILQELGYDDATITTMIDAGMAQEQSE